MGGASEGGAEIFFIDAITAIKKKKIKQHVIISNRNKERIKKVIDLKIPYSTSSFNKLFKWNTKKVISEAIKEFEPDIIHYWMGRASSFLIHGKHINIGWHSGYRGVERFRNCDYHIALTNDLKNHIIKQGIKKNKIYELPIFTKKNNLKKINRGNFDTPKNKPLLLSLSRLHPVKGIDILLNAMVLVPDAYLWVAGSGPLEKKLKTQMKRLNLDKRVKFLGWREDNEKLMATADICVFPSRNDSFGAVTIESWAAKKTIVACNSPGPLTTISHMNDGVLVEIDNIQQLAKALNNLINNRNLTEKLAKNGYKKFKKNYTEKVFGNNIIDIYTKILPKKS